MLTHQRLVRIVVFAMGASLAAPAISLAQQPRAQCPHADETCPKPEAQDETTTQAPAPDETPTDVTEPSAREPLTPEPATPEPEPMAQEPTYVEPAPVVVTTPPPVVVEEEEDTLERYGIMIALGGGVSGFTDDTMRDTTNDGGAWGVRLGIGTRSPIAFEAEYFGSAQQIDALGLENDAVLVGNGVQGVARVNLLDMNIQPFLFGGVAWRHYNLSDEGINTSAVNDTDDVLEIPMGGGIGLKYRGFLFDARGEYRYVTEENLMPSSNDLGDQAKLHRWGVTGNIGYAF